MVLEIWRGSIDWKVVSIVPVSMKKNDPGNFCPVSLPSVLEEVTEKIIWGVIEKQL